MIYAGVGSRNISDDVRNAMVYLGEVFATRGCILRSGAADGADAAFEQGCDIVGGTKEIYLPWKKFNGHGSQFYEPPKRAYEIASEHHPNWDRLTQPQKRLMARNVQQVLGQLLYEPCDFVVCWTKDGVEEGDKTTKETGGTGMAIRISSHYDVPVFNLANEDAIERLVDFVGENE